MLLTIINLIVALLPPILKGVGVNTNIDNLVAALGTALAGIIAGLKSSTPVQTELSVLQTALTALEQDTSLDPTILEDIGEGLRDLQAAITAYQAAQVNTDPSTLTPLPTV